MLNAGITGGKKYDTAENVVDSDSAAVCNLNTMSRNDARIAKKKLEVTSAQIHGKDRIHRQLEQTARSVSGLF
jgi:hypothetical protein